MKSHLQNGAVPLETNSSLKKKLYQLTVLILIAGYGNMAPVTVSGRAFCILFAIVGIPFTLSVIADVGQIFATIVSTVWAKLKPILTPIMDFIK